MWKSLFELATLLPLPRATCTLDKSQTGLTRACSKIRHERGFRKEDIRLLHRSSYLPIFKTCPCLEFDQGSVVLVRLKRSDEGKRKEKRERGNEADFFLILLKFT